LAEGNEPDAEDSAEIAEPEGSADPHSDGVFISYASQDASAAERIASALRAAGIEVWFDQSELRGGDAWDASIRRQIKNCALFIPVISKNTHARGEGYFRLEWKLAVDRSHLMASDLPFLLPVVVDNTPDQEDRVPDRFREVQWTRLPGGAKADAFVKRVHRLLSPEAPMPAASVQSSAPPRSSTGTAAARSTLPASRSFVRWIAGGLVFIAAGYFVFDRFVPPRHSVPAAEKAVTAPVQGGQVSDKSVAVLPFTDMSEKHDQEYFGDGVAEEILDLLAKASQLEVIARTSSFSFKGKSDDIPTIAGKLHVAYILEGSVRRSGKRLRVTTQLVRASTGVHMWSETYDRDLKDIFTVQDEIASAVVAALKLQLLPSQPLVSTHRTASQEAYAHYLRGLELVRQDSRDDDRHAVDEFAAAINLDSGYAAAYAGLADSTYRVADQNGDEATFRRAVEAADRSLSLDPELPEGYITRVRIRTGYSRDFAGARADAERALALSPGDARALLAYAFVLICSGKVTEGIAAERKALDVDPLNRAAWISLALRLLNSGHPADAEQAGVRALEISPQSVHAQYVLARIYLVEGRVQDALNGFHRIESDGLGGSGVAMAEYTMGHARESQAALDRLIAAHSADAAYQIAEVYAWRGDTEQAFRWLDRAYVQRDGGLTTMKTNPILAPLRSDARYKALLGKMNLPD
jgi:TolB-like protein/cytochrome c-type biogenesis protein CcmH/NrfG